MTFNHFLPSVPKVSSTISYNFLLVFLLVEGIFIFIINKEHGAYFPSSLPIALIIAPVMKYFIGLHPLPNTQHKYSGSSTGNNSALFCCCSVCLKVDSAINRNK